MDNFKNLQLKKNFVGILFTIILTVELGKSELTYEHCNEETNTTLICNYIPKTLARQYSNIRILGFKRKYTSVTINSSSFTGHGWEKVETIEFSNTTDSEFLLTFSRECFQGLRSLKELKIHESNCYLDENAFLGLSLVHTLDVSRCYRLVFEDVSCALKAKDSLPGLRNLIMSGIGAYKGSNNIYQKDVDNILPRNLTKVDISRTEINFVNITAVFKGIKTLQIINMSNSIIGDMWETGIVQKDMTNLKILDISHSVLPARSVSLFPGEYIMLNRTVKYSEMSFKNDLKLMFTPTIVNASSMVPDAVSVWIYNYTFFIDEPLDWKVKQLILRKNKVKYLDLKVVCRDFKFTSLLHLDLSENGLEFLHPLMCFPNLEIIDLSKNKIFKLLAKEPDLFDNLFASNVKLRIINLSNNQLPILPKDLFKKNINIEVIDVSFNNLTQLNLDLTTLKHLRIFDVRNNKLEILDEVSISSLTGIPFTDDSCTVRMTSNPFRCSACSCKSSIQWLLSSSLVNLDQQAMYCVTEDDRKVQIDSNVLRSIQTICARKMITILSTVCSLASLLMICLIGFFLFRRKRKLQRKKNMENVIANFINGDGQFEFVAFLTYCSQDEQFVQDHVMDPLNENLKLMIGTDRNLICTGDQHFRPGFQVHDELDLCLDRVSVVIVIVSDNFCRSGYCRQEFDQAYWQRKPILLMLLGHVDEKLMMPTLNRLFKREVRILWKIENEQFVLTTTWENICSSVLEKVQV